MLIWLPAALWIAIAGGLATYTPRRPEELERRS